MGLVNNELFLLIRDYFKSYLPIMRKSSPNTIRSYQTAMEQFLDYLKDYRKIKLYEVTIEMINIKTVTTYLKSIEETRACSVSTRNHRLNCIRAFLKYAASCNLEAAACWNEIQLLKPARNAVKPVDYLSLSTIEAILAQPDITTLMGLRDMFLMLFLYQTGARVQELVDVHIKNISFGKTAVVTLHGKGAKVRCVPLREKLVEHLNRYIATFHPQAIPYSDEYLFFTKRDGKRTRMSEDNVRRLVQKYGKKAQEKHPDVPNNIHPHLFRHSRAMHLYQSGVALPLVSQWLGHSRLETTLIYAHADTEQKRQAIENAIPEESTLKLFLNSERYSIDDEDTIKQLYGLR